MDNHVTHREAHDALCQILAGEHTLTVPPQDTDADRMVSRYIVERFQAECPLDDCEGTPFRCARCEAQTAGIKA